MTTAPSPIAGFEDWPAALLALGRLAGHNPASDELARVLGVPGPVPTLLPSADGTWVIGDVRLQQLSWQLPYGPPTRAHLLTPATHQGTLPGVLWLNCHGGNKWLGSERLIDAGEHTDADVFAVQRELYSGKAVANELARAGFAVLVHDSFSWGSRRFPLDPPPVRIAEGLAARQALWRQEGIRPTPVMEYNAAAALHEHTIAKTAGLLGTSYAGMVAFEDLAALQILQKFPEVDSRKLGVGGFSGGGGRALVLSALAPEVRAAVVSCMMTTFTGLFPSHLDTHSWLLTTPGLAAHFDWPELTSVNPASEYLIQFAERDPLFTPEGMRAAEEMLSALALEGRSRFSSNWYDAGHAVTAEMLSAALSHLTRHLDA